MPVSASGSMNASDNAWRVGTELVVNASIAAVVRKAICMRLAPPLAIGQSYFIRSGGRALRGGAAALPHLRQAAEALAQTWG